MIHSASLESRFPTCPHKRSQQNQMKPGGVPEYSPHKFIIVNTSVFITIFFTGLKPVRIIYLFCFRPVLHADIVITHKEPVTSAKYNGAFRQVLTCSEGSVSH